MTKEYLKQVEENKQTRAPKSKLNNFGSPLDLSGDESHGFSDLETSDLDAEGLAEPNWSANDLAEFRGTDALSNDDWMTIGAHSPTRAQSELDPISETAEAASRALDRGGIRKSPSSKNGLKMLSWS